MSHLYTSMYKKLKQDRKKTFKKALHDLVRFFTNNFKIKIIFIRANFNIIFCIFSSIIGRTDINWNFVVFTRRYNFTQLEKKQNKIGHLIIFFFFFTLNRKTSSLKNSNSTSTLYFD